MLKHFQKFNAALFGPASAAKNAGAKKTRRNRRGQLGQTTIEYIFIVVMALVVAKKFMGSFSNSMTNSATQLSTVIDSNIRELGNSN